MITNCKYYCIIIIYYCFLIIFHYCFCFFSVMFWFLTTYYLLLFLSLLPSSHDDGYQHFVPINPSEVHVCSFSLEAQEEQQCIRRRGVSHGGVATICWKSVGRRFGHGHLQHVKLLMIHRKYDVDDGGFT